VPEPRLDAHAETDHRFQPRGLLRSAHLQSILPSLSPLRTLIRRRAAAALHGARELMLDCGDGVRLQAFHTAGHRSSVRRDRHKLAVLLHGWEGSAESPYVLGLGARLIGEGFDVLRLNLRDHGATHHLNRDIFHSCRLSEVVGALRAVAQQFCASRLYLAGFSLGGNFMLRAAADSGLPSAVVGAVAVSPVLDPAATLLALEQGMPIYHSYFVRRWSQSLRNKARAWPGVYDFHSTLRAANLRRMTADLVALCTDFDNLDAYLAGYAITDARLATLLVPAALLLAQDDPIIPAGDWPRLARSEKLHVTLTRHGGHCGFFEHWLAPSFAEAYVLEQFERFERL